MPKLSLLVCDCCGDEVKYTGYPPDDWLASSWVLCPTCLRRIVKRAQVWARELVQAESTLFTESKNPERCAAAVMREAVDELGRPNNILNAGSSADAEG